MFLKYTNIYKHTYIKGVVKIGSKNLKSNNWLLLEASKSNRIILIIKCSTLKEIGEGRNGFEFICLVKAFSAQYFSLHKFS
jgi:hypothetical protein